MSKEATDAPSDLNLKLGQRQEYVDSYSPELLQAIPRHLARVPLGITDRLPFVGGDVWTAFELSWLDGNGRPRVAVAEFYVPADSPNIVESKSFKYYLNSFNQTVVANVDALAGILEKDVSATVGARVEVTLYGLEEFAKKLAVSESLGECLDERTLNRALYQPDATLLQLVPGRVPVDEVVVSHLLKSNCPVTGQPDWASVWIGYRGARIVPESLLGYLVSYRQHQDFHENCVEKIFCDIAERCQPEALWVYARFTRRGGLDINPFRSSYEMAIPNVRGARQ